MAKDPANPTFKKELEKTAKLVKEYEATMAKAAAAKPPPAKQQQQQQQLGSAPILSPDELGLKAVSTSTRIKKKPEDESGSPSQQPAPAQSKAAVTSPAPVTAKETASTAVTVASPSAGASEAAGVSASSSVPETSPAKTEKKTATPKKSLLASSGKQPDIPTEAPKTVCTFIIKIRPAV